MPESIPQKRAMGATLARLRGAAVLSRLGVFDYGERRDATYPDVSIEKRDYPYAARGAIGVRIDQQVERAPGADYQISPIPKDDR